VKNLLKNKITVDKFNQYYNSTSSINSPEDSISDKDSEKDALLSLHDNSAFDDDG